MVRGMKRNNIQIARNLRKNQTDAEKKLWLVLRNRQLCGVKFRRQFPIGRYVLDFYCPYYKLGIEADGGQHYENKERQRDEFRASELSELGVQILRFNDKEILTNIEGVCEVIERTIKEKRKVNSPSPQSSPHRGEEAREKIAFHSLK